ncbi:GH92 family glycosyl hydrolase [Parapedobacter koreensis]|uniref:Alpha-1,2-mannosidase, putative n=1 Tax=Parapedobacter koreensis TaxID=332977 RepID=A0A1H7PWW1_9SPHI|nr:GH92 family glycosyl hydrolase [Parapedobacter koreensis]SEL40222.1 alpha-1,2-mannosidase, putative [Parapedobacter koreensis]
MNKLIYGAFSALLASNGIACAQDHEISAVFDPVAWVNPLMGTDSKGSFSNGNTYPAIAVPWGMNFWSPQTGRMGDGWMYTYGAERIRGFKQTHQPSPWMNDYGQFSIMPGSGRPTVDQDGRASWFSHKAETATPYYYSVYLADADVTTEITPTERAAVFRFTFPQSDSSFVAIDAFDQGSEITILPEEGKIIGYSSKYSRGKLPNFRNYFVIQFDKPFAFSRTWCDSVYSEGSYAKGDHAAAIIGFKTQRGEEVTMRVASSFISHEQAALNLRREVGNKTFQQVADEARTIWSETLGRVTVEGGTHDQFETFYSCLYRTVLFPNRLYEVDDEGTIVHYSPYNGKVIPGYLFGGTGFWDTFRALYPFLNLVYPEINVEMQAGLVNAYHEGGWLPEWSSPGYANIMVGNNSASVVSDAYIKGLRGYDIQTLYEALLHGANNEGPMTAVGRAGAPYYIDLGYVPYDVGINENAARTLEYAYDDFAIYQLAKKLKRPEGEIELYAQRSRNYRHLFDPETGLMRGKNKDGNFQSPFNPFKWGDAFTEGNSWHYSWSVFHDIEGLARLMGGHQAFASKLDSVFLLPPIFDESYYGSVIHEIREMQVADMGQYAHGNQPIQHMTYLYNYVGQPWKSQYWVRETINRMYNPRPDGYCGDEDNGQTSAWYVFSALGFYPVCPATDEYVMGAPLFKKATVYLSNGKQLVINAPENSAENRYMQSVQLNGEPYDKNFLKHSALLKGATLDIRMSAQPNRKRGVAPSAFPYSLTNELD